MKYLCLLVMLLNLSFNFTIGADAQDESLSDNIIIERDNLAPEGLEYYSERQHFLISSMAEGTVYSVTDDGELTLFIEDEELISSIGLEVDSTDQRLLVVGANANMVNTPDETGIAQLGIYDLETGERLHLVDLGALLPDYTHFANDVAIDNEGNAYVTDSLAPVIYKVDPEGVASVFIEDERLLIDGFGGNGIVYHPDGYLLVGVSGVELFKIPLDEPEAFTVVDTDRIVAADGMIWHPDGALIVVSNGEIITVTSENEWQTATVKTIARNLPATTVTIRNGEIYVILPFYEANPGLESRIVRVAY